MSILCISETKSKEQNPSSNCMHQPVTSWSNARSTSMHLPVMCMHRPVLSQADARIYCMGSKVSSLSQMYLYSSYFAIKQSIFLIWCLWQKLIAPLCSKHSKRINQLSRNTGERDTWSCLAPVFNSKLGRTVRCCTVSQCHTCSLFWSWKLGPGFVLSAWVCSWKKTFTFVDGQTSSQTSKSGAHTTNPMEAWLKGKDQYSTVDLRVLTRIYQLLFILKYRLPVTKRVALMRRLTVLTEPSTSGSVPC